MPRTIRPLTAASFLLLILAPLLPLSDILLGQTMVGHSPVDIQMATRGGSDLEYVIITTSELQEGFEPLADWRMRTGLRTGTFLLDGEGGILEGPGRDDAERLFNFLHDLREQNGGSLRYVLLGGDSDQVPVRYLHAGASEWELDDSYLSDVYYSSPDTVWDKDGDGLYGERGDIEIEGSPDLSFDLVVGRVPASTLVEAERYSERAITYEQAPEPGAWTSRMLLASSLMDRPNVLNNPDTEEDEGYDAYKDNGFKAITNQTLQFIPMSMDITEVHDHPSYEGLNYAEENDSLGFDTLPDMISSGCALLSFAGQSFYDVEYPVSPPLAYSLAQYIDPQGLARGGAAFGEALTYQDVLGLDNGGKLPVMYFSSCDSANFSDPLDRDLSNIVLAPSGGAICMIGSTGISWRGEGVDYSLGNWYLMSRYWQQFMGSGCPGEALRSLKSHYVSAKWDELATKEPLLVGIYAYNLMGDPALGSWMGPPLSIGQVGAPTSVRAGGEYVRVEVRTSSDVPLYGATVALVHPSKGEVFKGSTGPDGTVEIWTDFSGQGDAILSIRARNHLPHFQNLTLLPSPPDVEVLNGSVQVGPQPLSEGKPATVRGMVRNNGKTDIKGATVAIFPQALDEGLADWPDPLMASTVDLLIGRSELVIFNVTPDRTWRVVTFAVYPVGGETHTSDNMATLGLSVNARPRFLSLPAVELDEDLPGGREVHLGSYIFDPDDPTEDLEIAVQEGTPEWIAILGADLLKVYPPENWSGSLRVGLRVWDGLVEDTATLQVTVLPVNDAPVIMGLPNKVTALTGQVFVLPLDIVDAESDQVQVKVSSPLAAMTYTGGSLRLLTYEEDQGLHAVNISVSDIWGAVTNYSMTIEIKAAGTDLYFEEPSVHLPSAQVGEHYQYTIKMGGALSSGARFQDNTSLFDIDETTGRISFTPAKGDKGEHWVRITVMSGNTTVSRAFIIEVIKGKSGPSLLVIGLAAIVVLLLVLLVSIFLWKGPEVGQYGLEE